jgi:transposase InsO family protein
MQVYLARQGYNISPLTAHKYMNVELQLFSISRKRKPAYESGIPHKVFENKLNQDFTSTEINRKWCTDFTYLFLTDGSKRYNCSIIDLHERCLIASITDKHITADLAKRTLQKAIDSQPGIDTSKLILHSDQGSQYTSKEFTDYCASEGITQSMSKAGYPYDNAPMERYFNTLKNELINHHYYHSEEELYTSVEEFAYVHYNHVRPHSYDKYKTPFEARYGV